MISRAKRLILRARNLLQFYHLTCKNRFYGRGRCILKRGKISSFCRDNKSITEALINNLLSDLVHLTRLTIEITALRK